MHPIHPHPSPSPLLASFTPAAPAEPKTQSFNGRHHHKMKRSRMLFLLRIYMLDLPLLTSLLAWVLMHRMQIVYEKYYVPMFDRAQRSDNDLLHEYTYYNRECTHQDLSTDAVSDLVVQTFINGSFSNQQITHLMLRHGVIVLPDLLSAPSVTRLRSYIQRRNAEISQDEQYPVSQGHRRISYGIDATEDPAVIHAIVEIAHNPVLRSTLVQLLGDADPASAEITAITGFLGCPHQAWHSDTKSDGNALKFARTYSHSYSLFVALQDITYTMGATDVCPGTHFCANDVGALCEQTALRLSEVTVLPSDEARNQTRVWRAGDAALLNQHMWHRGSAHEDPHAPERIVFIMSFLARPQIGSSDTRQLSRGTYFHQKWNMWGHTYQDLLHPLKRMRFPFSILRCLHLWKPAGSHWGYDLITSVFLRFSNKQLEDTDLAERFVGRLDQLGFPSVLRGQIVEDTDQKEAWVTFLRGTIHKTLRFVKAIAVIVLLMYVLVVVVISAATPRQRLKYSSHSALVRSAGLRILVSGMLAGLLSWWIGRWIDSSDWAQRISYGKTFMKAFPEDAVLRSVNHQLGISQGPTTLPHRNDVLLGTRLDAPFLGSYDQWLDYHPGNRVFRQILQDMADLYHRTYSPFSSQQGLQSAVRQHIRTMIQLQGGGGGRLVLQDPNTGDWRVLTESEIDERIREELVVQRHVNINFVWKELDYAIAEFRFGVNRGTSLANFELGRLWNFKKKIINQQYPYETNDRSFKSPGSLLLPDNAHPDSVDDSQSPPLSPPFCFTRYAWRSGQCVMNAGRLSIDVMNPSRLVPLKRSVTPSDLDFVDNLRPGTLVLVYYEVDSFFYPGSIVEINKEQGTASISYRTGEYEYEVDVSRIVVQRSIVEGIRVMGCYTAGLDDCYPGTIHRVHPSGACLVEFDDGDVEWLSPSKYYLPPHPTKLNYDDD